MSSRLGEILVKDSLISTDQLKQALDHQKKNGGRLGTCLVKLGLVSDDDITAVSRANTVCPRSILNSTKWIQR